MSSVTFASFRANRRLHFQVSVVSFKLVNAEAIVHMVGDDFGVSAQVYHVLPQEYGNINLDKFHQKFNTGK